MSITVTLEINGDLHAVEKGVQAPELWRTKKRFLQAVDDFSYSRKIKSFEIWLTIPSKINFPERDKKLSTETK